jgi:hypothetical protein
MFCVSLNGVTEIVGRDRFENYARRVGFVLSRCRGVFIEAFSALKHLEDSEPVQSPAFLDREFRGTPGTRRA